MNNCLYKEVCLNKTCEYCKLKDHKEIDKLAYGHLLREVEEYNKMTYKEASEHLI